MRKVKRYLGALLGIISLLLFQVFKLLPYIVEAVYTNGFYRGIRFIYYYSLAYIPFPILYLFVFVVIFVLVKQFLRDKPRRWLGFLANFLGWIIFLFYFLWGFNYARVDFAKRTQVPIQLPEESFLLAELLSVDSILMKTRSSLQPSDTIALDVDLLPEELEEIIRNSQVQLLKYWGEPVFKNPKIRSLKPKGSLLRIKTAGVYFPFVLEGHIDDGLHPIEKPYVMAHEMAHAYAITDEGECNFIGFITCINADHPFVQYSGWLEYQGYIYRALRRNYPEALKAINYQLPLSISTDLKAIRERLDKYPNIAPWLRDLFYNNYLKAQGISDGIKSYAHITRLAYSYKMKYGDFLVE